MTHAQTFQTDQPSLNSKLNEIQSKLQKQLNSAVEAPTNFSSTKFITPFSMLQNLQIFLILKNIFFPFLKSACAKSQQPTENKLVL
jgi:hypothetical protein